MTKLSCVIETQSFLGAAARLMSEKERTAVVDRIASDPEGGLLIKGAHGLRKLRIPLQGRGKRGGGRVVYWYHSAGYPAALLFAYAKNEVDDLTAEQRKRFAAVGAAIIRELGVKS